MSWSGWRSAALSARWSLLNNAFIALLDVIRRCASSDLQHEVRIGDVANLEVFTSSHMQPNALSGDDALSLEERSQYDAGKLAVYAEDLLKRAEKAIDER